MGRVLQNLCVLENRSTLLGVEVERQLTKFFMMTPSRDAPINLLRGGGKS